MDVDVSTSRHINDRNERSSKSTGSVGASITEDEQIVTLLFRHPKIYYGLITALESRTHDLTLEFVTEGYFMRNTIKEKRVY